MQRAAPPRPKKSAFIVHLFISGDPLPAFMSRSDYSIGVADTDPAWWCSQKREPLRGTRAHWLPNQKPRTKNEEPAPATVLSISALQCGKILFLCDEVTQ